MKKRFQKILVIGGGGYVGAVLVPKLLKSGYDVSVYDLFIYTEEVFDSVKNDPHLKLIKGDVRDIDSLSKAIKDSEAVIHLACISNDPSVELDPGLAKSINLDSFEPCIKAAKQAGVKRFIYASSSSVYGVKEVENVTEDMELIPLTDYSKYKAACEKIALSYASKDFTVLVLRPATVCGYSPRQRLDLTVNILTNHAINNKKINVFGGAQRRPNIHIQDITDLYIKALEYEDDQINGKIYNAGYENFKVMELATMVKEELKTDVTIEVVPTDDNRSYHISSGKIKKELGFAPRYTIRDAINDLKEAFEKGLIDDPMNNTLYYNIKRMKEIKLK